MKKILKWAVIIFAIFIIIGVLASGGKDKNGSAPTSSPQQENTSTTENSSTPKNKPTITKAEFDQIKSGMTYEEVTKIVGGPGELLSESGNPGDPAHTVMYQFEGEGDLGANANMLFQGNKLQNKAQMGLK